MNYNPYQAPEQLEGSGPGGSPAGGGAPQSWELGEVLGVAWRAFSQNAPVLIFAPILAGLIELVPIVAVCVGVVMTFMNGSFDITTLQSPDFQAPFQGSMLAMQVVLVFIQSFFQVGLTRIWLGAARGESPGFALLFSGGARFVPMLGLEVLFSVATWIVGGVGVLGLVLEQKPLVYTSTALNYLVFFVMLVLWGLGLIFSSFFVVDAKRGPIDALKEAWRASEGQRGQVFLFCFVVLLIYLAGMIACGFGMLVTAPLARVALAVVYTRLTGSGAGAALPTGYPMPYASSGPPPAGIGAPPPGGYGGPPGYS